MARPKLTLYLDIVSPFAYMAFYITKNSPIFKQCDVTYVPIFLGGLMQACGNTPPIRIKNKDKWIEVERNRWAKLFKIPIVDKTPEGFPPNTITAQRALIAIQSQHPSKLTPAFSALYQSFWVESKPIGKPETVSSALASVFSEAEVKDLMAKVGTPEVKKGLSESTEKAMRDGAFGLPWFVATNGKGETEGFWGVDHLGQVLRHLGLEGKGSEEGFRAML